MYIHTIRAIYSKVVYFSRSRDRRYASQTLFLSQSDYFDGITHSPDRKQVPLIYDPRETLHGKWIFLVEKLLNSGKKWKMKNLDSFHKNTSSLR